MTAYLVLVRHGQAQTRSAALADEHRHLTEAGARAFRVTWEQALPMLPAADVAVVSSTYDRAEETAAIAAQSMGAGPVERWESLAGEDGDAFNHDLEHLLDRLTKIRGKFLLCNFASDILTDYAMANGWQMTVKDMPMRVANFGGHSRRKQEVMVCNYCLEPKLF